MGHYFICPQCGEKISAGVTALFVLDNLKCPKCGFDFRKARANLDTTVLNTLKDGGFIKAIQLHRTLTGTNLNDSKIYIEELAQKHNIPVPKTKCFIAAACCGSYDAHEVWILRAYRDEVLEKTISGRLFISVYYFLSPPVAKYIERSELLKSVFKKYLIRPFARYIIKNRP